MKVVEHSNSRLVIRSLPIMQTLLGLVFIGAFMAILYLIGQSINIHCEKKIGQGWSCVLQHKIIGIYETRKMEFHDVKKAIVEELLDHYGKREHLFRVVLITDKENIPLTSAYTADYSSKESFANRFNELLSTEQRGGRFDMEWGIPWWFYPVAILFGGVGVLIIFSGRVIYINIDKATPLLIVTSKGIFSQTSFHCPIHEIREFTIKTHNLGRGTNLYSLNMWLTSDKEIDLTHSWFSYKKHERVIKTINSFLKE